MSFVGKNMIKQGKFKRKRNEEERLRDNRREREKGNMSA
jgi:hypothetical protein